MYSNHEQEPHLLQGRRIDFARHSLRFHFLFSLLRRRLGLLDQRTLSKSRHYCLLARKLYRPEFYKLPGILQWRYVQCSYLDCLFGMGLTIHVLKAEFESFTEVSRCGSNSNSWCCAGAAGQSLGGVDCCTTNSTTPLEPYPLSTIEGSKTSKTTLRSIGSATTEHATSSLKPTLLQTSIFGSATSSPTSAGLPSSAPRVVRDHDSKLGIKIGVPIAVVIIFLLAFLAFFIRRRNRSHKPGAAALHEKSTDERSNLKPELEGNSAMELDVTHYELSHSEPPRHELG